MVTSDSDSTPQIPPLTPHRPPVASAGKHGQGHGRLVAMALVAGLLAGVAAWLVGETILGPIGPFSIPRSSARRTRSSSARFASGPIFTSAVGTFTAPGRDRQVQSGDGGWPGSTLRFGRSQGGARGMRSRIDRRASTAFVAVQSSSRHTIRNRMTCCCRY